MRMNGEMVLKNMIGPKKFHQLWLSTFCWGVVIAQNFFRHNCDPSSSYNWSNPIPSSAVKRDTQIVHDSRINENNGYQLSRSRLKWRELWKKENAHLMMWMWQMWCTPLKCCLWSRLKFVSENHEIYPILAKSICTSKHLKERSWKGVHI